MRILRLIILASLISFLIWVAIIFTPLTNLINLLFKPLCGSDDFGICSGIFFTLLFLVAIMVITSFLGEKLLREYNKKKVFIHLMVVPIVIFLTFFLMYLLQKVLYKF